MKFLDGLKAGYQAARKYEGNYDQLPDPADYQPGTRITCRGFVYEAFRWTDDPGPATHWSEL